MVGYKGAHFQGFVGSSRGQSGSKQAQNWLISLDCAPQMVHDHCGTIRFDPFLTHFWSQICPFSGIVGFSVGQTTSPRAQNRAKNTSLSIPSGLGTSLEKIFFCHPRDPALAPTMRGLGYPLAPPSGHWFGGLGVPLGEFEAWKPQKVGDCRWTRCPRNCDLWTFLQIRLVLGFGAR